MRAAICPGSFDPITFGHLDIITRTSKMFDKLYVAVLSNSAKKPSFTVDERMEMIRKCTSDISNIEVCTFDGLLASFAKRNDIMTLVKGLRAVSDFEYEFQMALANKKLNHEMETIFLPTSAEYMFLSSSIVKEIARNGGSIHEFVPAAVLSDIEKRNEG